MRALRALRREDDDIIMWTDALYINQADQIEKEHQVSLMDSIDIHAIGVDVWLGALENARLAPHFFDCTLTEGSEHHDIGTVSKDVSLSCEIVCARPYWSRAWIIQVLAKSLTIHCGMQHISWSTLSQVWEQLIHRQEYCHLKTLGFSYQLCVLLSRYANRSGCRERVPILPLDYLLGTFRGVRCYFTRDRIFSFLGICQALIICKGFLVSYSIDLGTLFLAIIRLCEPPSPTRLAHLLQEALGVTATDVNVSELRLFSCPRQDYPTFVLSRLARNVIRGYRRRLGATNTPSQSALKKATKLGGIFKPSKSN